MTDYLGLAFLIVVGLVLAGVLVWLGIGLFQARSLVRRELAAYFLSPIAYVVLAVFLLVVGCRFYLTLDKLTASGTRGVEYPMAYMFSIVPQTIERTQTPLGTLEAFSGLAFWLIFLLIPAVLTMRLFAEERSTGTLESLMTAPLKDWQVVLSKYLACFIFYVVLWLPTLLYLPVLLDIERPVLASAWTPWSVALVAGLALVLVALVLAYLPGDDLMRVVALVLGILGLAATAIGGWGHYVGFQLGDAVYGQPWYDDSERLLLIPTRLDPMPVVCTYLGLILLGAMLLALGILVSSLVRSQLVAALVSVAVNLVLVLSFLLVGLLLPDVGPRLVAYFSVPLHISRDFGRGILDTRHLVLYGSVTVFALFLTVRSLESRRWR